MIRFLWILPLFVAASAAAQPQNAEDLLRRGLELERQGAPGATLELWQQATAEPDVPSLAIATEFLRIATEHKLRDYYRPASDAFYRVLTADDEESVTANKEALSAELVRTGYLLDNRQVKSWEKLLEKNDPLLLEELRLFWEQKDINPGSSYNERLLEHWERIAHARKHYFSESDGEIDDRGRIYVRYGQPDKISEGQLHLSPAEVTFTVNQFFVSATRVARSGIDNKLRAFIKSLENATMNYHWSSDKYYEIWVYDRPNSEMENNLIRIFGTKSEGKFTELGAIDEMIPSRAFSMSNRHSFTNIQTPSDKANVHEDLIVNFDLTPGMVMQFHYYQQLNKVDNYFGYVFDQVDKELHTINNDNTSSLKHQGGRLKQKNLHELKRLQNSAPANVSTDEKALPSIPFEVFQYRFLDADNQPVFVTFLESSPVNVVTADLSYNQDKMTSGRQIEERNHLLEYYKLTHGVQLRDERWQLLSHNRMAGPIIMDHVENTPGNSLFIIPYVSGEHTQVFYAELENLHPESEPKTETVFAPELRGLGRLELSQPEPLILNENTLMVSDLVIGYQKSEPSQETYFDFVVSNQRQIPEGENLVVHFEAYRLESDEGGIARFEVDYEIRPQGGLLGWTKKDLDEFDITLGFETDSDRFAESLEIEAAGLLAGKYELAWTVCDLQNGQSHEQQIRFEVTETG